jgi:hypothetical protein
VSEEWYNIAYRMLSHRSGGAPFKLDPDLESELRALDDLCCQDLGELRSRQAIAMAILGWSRRNHGRSGIEYL